MVSKMVTEGNRKPLFMFREKRSRPEDSGWRIFSGFESDEYANDHKNFGIYNPTTILKIDISIATLLFKGVGSVYERESEKSPWTRVYDYHLEDDYLVKHKLTVQWELEINNLFERREEETGDLLYTTGDKSLRLAIWNYDNENKAEIYKNHQDIITHKKDSFPEDLKTFELSDSEISRIGYMIKEFDESREYNVIYGFSIVDNQVLQLALYFDDDEDLNWALATWKGIKRIKE